MTSRRQVRRWLSDVTAANCGRCREDRDGHDRESCACLLCHGFYATRADHSALHEVGLVLPAGRRAPGCVVEHRVRRARPSGREMVRTRQVKIRAGEGDLLVALYRQGRSSQEVADLTGRSVEVVRRLARKAGVIRPQKEGAGLAVVRRSTRARLARLDLRPQARRWMDGVEVEELAAELTVPADLLWDALAEVLAVMSPDARENCDAGRCRFACVAVCAATAEVGTSKVGRLY